MDATATLVVANTATVTTDQVDIVTAADDWYGFGDTGDATPGITNVRVDQGSVRIDIKGSTPDSTVTLSLDGGNGHLRRQAHRYRRHGARRERQRLADHHPGRRDGPG